MAIWKFASAPSRETFLRANARLEDRIGELGARALYGRDAQLSQTLHELQLAIHEQNLRVANLAGAAILGGRPDLTFERRDRAQRSEGHKAKVLAFKKQP